VKFGSDTYRRGAEARIEGARILLENKEYGGSIYLAGLSVECMLRSLIGLRDQKFDQRHDLRKLSVRVGDLGLLQKADRDHSFVSDVQAIARIWFNNLRFADDAQLRKWLLEIGELRKKSQGAFSAVAKEHFSRCHRFVKRSNLVWEKQKSRKKN
jgi:hypothetical protein